MIARVEHEIPSKKKERERKRKKEREKEKREREREREKEREERKKKNGDSLYSLHRRVITRGKLLYGSLCVANKDALFAKSIGPMKQITELLQRK